MHYPLFIDIKDKNILIIGGGKVGTRKAFNMLKSGALVTVISREFSQKLLSTNHRNLKLITKKVDEKDIDTLCTDKYFLVVIATDDKRINGLLYDEIKKNKNSLVCRSDDRTKTDVIFPAYAEKEGIAIASFGKNPSLAKRLRILLESAGENKPHAFEKRIAQTPKKAESTFPKNMRELRKNQDILEKYSETALKPADFIFPVFVKEGIAKKEPILSLKGHYRYSLNDIYEIVRECEKYGVRGVLLFGIPEKKDDTGSEAYNDKGIVQAAIKKIKSMSRVNVYADLCMCQYTSHGHCGILMDGEIDNEETLKILDRIAVSYARAGADFVCPSAMMDFQVKSIRNALDGEGFFDVKIMSYSAKFASNFYGPFRDAAGSSPKAGPKDRKTYQLDFRNSRQALKEIELDVEEEADIVMVKPALAYLDIIAEAKKRFDVPIAAYNVSGEYAALKNSSMDLLYEAVIGIKRAGADVIISYGALEILQLLAKAGAVADGIPERKPMQLDEKDREIIRALQESVPQVERPFKEVANRIGIIEKDVLVRIRKMKEEGIIKRIGCIIDPASVGYYGTLVAMECPKDKTDEIAKIVNECDGVTHNYLRDGYPNLWFTLIGENRVEVRRMLDWLKAKIPYPMTELEAKKRFKIGVRYDI